jgi:hypothetical protein
VTSPQDANNKGRVSTKLFEKILVN